MTARPFGTEKRAEGAGPKSKNRLLKVVGSCSRIGCLKENVPGNFCPSQTLTFEEEHFPRELEGEDREKGVGPRGKEVSFMRAQGFQ